MMRFRLMTIAAAVGLGVLFAGPDITNATPLTPISSPMVTTVAGQSEGVEQVRWRHGCCGYRRGYGAPLYFGFGFGYPYYGGYGYPYYGGYGYGGYYGGRYYRHGRHYGHHRYYGHHRRHR